MHSERGTRKGVSLSNGLALRDIENSHKPEETEVFIELPTDKRLQFINSFSFIAIFSHSTVQREV